MRNKEWYLKIIIIAITLYYMGAMLSGYKFVSEIVRAFIMPSIMLLYYWHPNKKHTFFTLFLITFSMAEFIYFFQFKNEKIGYYLGNISYIVAYASLFIHIIININFKKLLKHYTFYLIILLALGIYIFCALDNMINYHVNMIPFIEYIVESVYNLAVVLVLVFSFLHYIYNMTKRSLLLFLASLFLCFSELAQVAYYFIKAERIISIVYSILLIIGFYFTYSYIVCEESRD